MNPSLPKRIMNLREFECSIILTHTRSRSSVKVTILPLPNMRKALEVRGCADRLSSPRTIIHSNASPGRTADRAYFLPSFNNNPAPQSASEIAVACRTRVGFQADKRTAFVATLSSHDQLRSFAALAAHQ